MPRHFSICPKLSLKFLFLQGSQSHKQISIEALGKHFSIGNSFQHKMWGTCTGEPKRHHMSLPYLLSHKVNPKSFQYHFSKKGFLVVWQHGLHEMFRTSTLSKPTLLFSVCITLSFLFLSLLNKKTAKQQQIGAVKEENSAPSCCISSSEIGVGSNPKSVIPDTTEQGVPQHTPILLSPPLSPI